MAVTIPAATDADHYDDLYARWERGNWRATEIDFTQDKIDWQEKLTEQQRKSALWLYTLFFHGEDSVADNLSPYIDAAPLEEQKYFLTTQQVDEARHAVFFKRFMHEVVGLGDGSVAAALQATPPDITWGHRMVFGRLDRDGRRAARGPLAAQARVGGHALPPHRRGEPRPARPAHDRDVARGDGRHARLPRGHAQRRARRAAPHRLRREAARRPATARTPSRSRRRSSSTLREVLPWTSGVAEAAGLGHDLHDVLRLRRSTTSARRARGRTRQKLRAVGLPLDDIAGFPMPMDVPPRERARRGRSRCCSADFLGPGDGAGRSATREAIEILFDTMRAARRGDAVPPGTTIQWDFTDMEPWHLRIEGRTKKSAVQGRIAKPTVRLKLRYDDFGELVSERAQPHHLMLRGRMRPWGDPRVLLKLQRLFH